MPKKPQRFGNQMHRLLVRQETQAFGVAIVCLIFIWIIAASLQGMPLNVSSIVYMHTSYLALWIAEFFLICVAVGYVLMSAHYTKEQKKLEQKLETQSSRIMRYAEFAQQIGEGRYDARLDQSDVEDTLGASLIRMRTNLAENNQKETANGWIARGKDEVAYVLRLHTNLHVLGYEVLRKLVAYIKVVQGGLFLYDEEKDILQGFATYAFEREKTNKAKFRIGEGLVGQCAYERGIIYRTEIPENFVSISSGLIGDKKPKSLLLVPLITNDKLEGVLEFASIRDSFSELEIRFLEEVGETIARTVFNLRISQKTEKLLHEAQDMAEELRKNEEELRKNAEDMQETHEELEHANSLLEGKIKEAENAHKRLHSLLENASEVISIYDANQQISYISPSVRKILGYTPQEMMEGKDIERLSQQGLNELREMFNQLIEHPRVPRTIQYVFMRRDGVKVSMEVTGRNLLDDPAIKGLILNSRDITERLRAEKEERMKSKMQSLSENSLDMIIRLNMEGQFFYANPVVAKYLGLPISELLNRRLDEVPIPLSLLEAFWTALSEIRATQKRWEHEVHLQRGDETVILRLLAIPEFDERNLETVLLVGHDITEAKRIEGEIQEKSKKITESINYAQRIQSSILPELRLIQQFLPKSFLYYRPRDVVSGDFPWFFRKGENLYVAAVDCTGHGVPGALLSFIGFFTLNNVVDHDASYSASEILDRLHAGVRTTLRQDRTDADARDGMDIALCKINLKAMELEFAGAHRPLFMVRQGELMEFKGDRRAIGGIPSPRRPEGNFTNHVIQIEPGDRIFFFSDGLPDQLGGPRGMKKFGPQRIRETIVEQRGLSMSKLAQYFESEFNSHMGEHKQLDDVLLIGIEF